MKKEERLHRLFGDIDDELVADAIRKPADKKVWIPLVAAAACVALTVALWQGNPFEPTLPLVNEPSESTGTTERAEEPTTATPTTDTTTTTENPTEPSKTETTETEPDDSTTVTSTTTEKSTESSKTEPSKSTTKTEPSKSTTKTEPSKTTTAKPTESTTLEKAKAAIAAGRYEAAYRYLLTDTSDEAAKLRENFCYVPVQAIDMQNGQVVATGQWTYTALGYPINQEMCDSDSNGKTKEETKDEYTYDDKGRVKTHTIIHIRNGKESREETTYDYDQQGNCIREELIGGAVHGSHVYTFTYNKRNQLLTRYEDFGAGNWNKYEYAYDADGNMLLEKTTRSNGDWTKAVSTYENGVQTSYEYTTEWGDYKKWHLEGGKKYSESYANGGNNHSKGISEGDKKLYNYWSFRGDVEETFYNYDDQDKLLTVLCWMETTGNYDRYYYDEWGNCTKVEQYVITDPDNPDGTAKFSQTLEAYTYVYDEEGNILQKEFRNNEGGIYEYVYDAKGNLLNHKQSNLNGTYWRTEAYTYDENSNMLSKREEHYDGRWTEETFNEAGNLLTKKTSSGKSYQYKWDLCYYPNGIPTDLQNFLDDAEQFYNDSELVYED